MADEAMTLQQAADALGVHYMTAYRYIRTGRLPATRVGGTWRVAVADLDLVRPGRRSDQPGASGPGPPTPPPIDTQLEARLLAGDETGAWNLIEAALVSGGPRPASCSTAWLRRWSASAKAGGAG